MSKIVYIVMGTTGEYSDRREWPVAVFLSKEMAEERVTLATRWVQEIVDYRTYRFTKHKNPYDLNMDFDYTGVDYFIYQDVPMIGE